MPIIEIPGSYSMEQLERLSGARFAGKLPRQSDADHVVDAGVQFYLGFRNNPRLLQVGWGGQSIKFEVSQETTDLITRIAGPV